MNKVYLIGNVCADPQLRSTKDGIQVCSFNLAVNHKGKDKETEFFKITSWRALADLCGKYLAKGRKVCVVGSVGASAYMGKDGKPKASIEVTADEVEFLSPAAEPQAKKDADAGFVNVDDQELPF